MIRFFSSAFVVLTIALAWAGFGPAAALAQGPMVSLGPLQITHAFTRATAPGAPSGGGWLTIANTGAEADRLVSASSPAASRVETHEMKMDNNVMVMRRLPDGVEIGAGETVDLKPGGIHLMFIGLAEPFVEGEEVPVTLTFEKAGTVTIQLPVAALGATDMPMTMDMN